MAGKKTGINSPMHMMNTHFTCLTSRLKTMALLACMLATGTIFSISNSQAQILTWDASGGPGPSDGSGTWLSADWWNGVTIVSGNWTATAPNGASFGAGTVGTFAVSLGGNSLYASNITFNTAGYTLKNGALTLTTGGGTTGITVASGVTNQINVALTNASGCNISLAASSVMTLAGGMRAPGGNPTFSGNSPGTSTLNMTNGVYFVSGTFDVNGMTMNITGTNTLVNSSSRLDIGRNAAATVNVSGGGQVIGGGINNIQISRGQVGMLNVQNGGLVSTIISSTGGNIVVLPDSSSQANLNVLPGAIVKVGIGASGISGVNNSGLSSVILLGGNSSTSGTTFSSSASGIVNVSGGTVTALGIQFGSSGGIYTANPTTQVNVTGGTVYLGIGGINLGTGVVGFASPEILLSGGTLAAVANWTSTMPMTLTNLNGNITIQAADALNTPFDVSLTSVLSGIGGMIKTGGGMLTLTGANTYSGSTIINAGTLALTTASSGAGTFSVASNATLSAQVAVAGASLNASSLTFSNGSSLGLDPNTFGNPTAPMINVSGALTPAGTVTIQVNGSTLTNGQFTLIKYGSLGGNGFGAFSLGPVTLPVGVTGSASLVNNALNQSIDLNVTTVTSQQLVWDGTINGNWDIGVTANWKTNAYYTQSNGASPAVVFDDTASGPSTAIVLNTNVTPASVTVSNSALTYSLNGSGGITGTAGLIKAGSGIFTLGGDNTYTGGTAINAGTLAVGTTNNAAMNYFVNGGKLATSVASPGTSLPMSSLTLGAGSPQLSFDFQNLDGTFTPAISDSGNLTLNGNVTVNATNLNLSSSGVAVLLRYAGTRSGTGSFVTGTVPAGVTITDDTVHQRVIAYQFGLRVVIPSLNTNEVVVAAATPQLYGAVGDGVTDDTAAFQNAMNAVYNSGGNGGGVVWVPAGNYAFYGNLSIPTGVTLHGNWTDWTKGTNGLVGTTFCVFTGAGQTNGTPFISMIDSTALRDVNIWYPNQEPNTIVGYPFTIGVVGDSTVNDVVLVNSYQGIEIGINPTDHSAEWILSTVIGTPLFMGIMQQGIGADISHAEDIRFSPYVWANSGLTNAPSAGGSYATWMRSNGTGIQMTRLDGFITIGTEISGYNVGMDFEEDAFGTSGSCFYNGWVTNCGTAVLAQEMQGQGGLEFSDFTLDGGTAVLRTHATNDAAAGFDNCTIIGRNGTAVSCLGADWQSSMSFQNCTISNTLALTGPGVFNLVNCQLQGSTQCVLSANATAAAFTGCTFSPSPKIINNGSANHLLMDSRTATSNAMPIVSWTNVVNSYFSCGPLKTNLYVATNYGATGNGTTDDTAAIQGALNAAGANGGGVVYLPPGTYHLTNTLDVPDGVELLGSYETRHSNGKAGDGLEKGAILQPYGGQGTTNGPPAIALETNAGLVGMTILYVNQNPTNSFAYPPTIQGRGANVFVIGVECFNPYIYLDLDTYNCTNHFIDMMDAGLIEAGVRVGNGSSGSIVDCEFGPYNLSFGMSNYVAYTFGNCTELLVKDFAINEYSFIHCVSEDGVGPTVTGISAMCDASYQCFVFDGPGSCTFNDVNPEWLVSLNGGYPGLTNQAAVLTTSNFQGTVHFFNSPIWGSHNSDYIINGGDVTMELVHLWQYAFLGTQVNAGSFHLINCGAFNVTDGGSGNPAYNLTLGPNAGSAGETNEVIGCFSYGGWNVVNDNVTNLANIWMDYALSNYSVLDVGPVVIGNVYPNGLYQFQSSSALTFMAYSPNGINTNGVTIQLTATNLLGQGYSTNINAANGLAVTGSSTTRSVGVPLATNAIYAAIIQVTDASGNSATNTVSFDTINPAYTFEAEDFDYNSGQFINNPQTDGYAGLSGTTGIDYTNNELGTGSASYRPQGLETEAAGDKPRLAYGGQQDYDVGFADVGNWGNYTRAFPAGTDNIYMRAASPGGPTADSVSISLVTSGVGTPSQTTTQLGTITVPNTGSFQTYAWAPLKTNTTTFATFTGGAVETLRARTDHTGYNANFYLLVTTNIQPPWMVAPAAPTGVTATPGNGQVMLNWTASPAATAYDVMRSTTNGGSFAVIASNVTMTVYTNSGLTNGTTYYYVVSSVSGLGEGANSAQASATPTGPIELAVNFSANNQIVLSWTTNGGNWTPYYTPNLTPPIMWSAVTNAPVLSNNLWNVALTLGTNSSGFYRLQL